MKKFFLATGVIGLVMASNVIYARQLNSSQGVCNVENCIQTRPTICDNSETCPYSMEGCTRTQGFSHDNCVEYNYPHHRNGRHH